MLHIRRDLPTGTEEPDAAARLKAWALVQDKAARMMGVIPYGLDPDVTFSDPSGRGQLLLTPEAAVALATWYDRWCEAGHPINPVAAAPSPPLAQSAPDSCPTVY